MNTNYYDHVIEVKKYIKKPWPLNSLDFSLKDDMYLMREASIRQTNYYLCEKNGKIYLIDSDNHEDEVFWVNLNKFVEVEIEDAVYRRYRVLK